MIERENNIFATGGFSNVYKATIGGTVIATKVNNERRHTGETTVPIYGIHHSENAQKVSAFNMKTNAVIHTNRILSSL